MPKKLSKPKVAIVSLTSCEGCQFVILDQGQKFLDLAKKIDIGDFRLIKEGGVVEEKYDICFVEGNPITKENIKLLKQMREKSKILVVLGNCAALGGVWEIKNYRCKHKTIKSVYKKAQVANPDIKEVDNFVVVDLTIPGCPIDGDEFNEMVSQLLSGKIPQIAQNPVCYECHLNGSECLLQKGEICLGPITLAGCKAVCLKSKQACWGCRGMFEGAQAKNMLKYLESRFSKDQIYRVLEIFGVRDDFANYINKK